MAHVEVVRRSMSFKDFSRHVLEGVRSLVVDGRAPTSRWRVRHAQYEKDGSYAYDDDLHPIAPGEAWGRPDGCALFEGEAEVPAGFAGRAVSLHWPIAAEVLVSVDGKVRDGLDPNRSVMPLIQKAAGGEKLSFSCEAYVRSKPDDERDVLTRSKRGCIQQFILPELVTIDDEAYRAHLELTVLREAAYAPSLDEDLCAFLEKKLQEALRALPPYEAPPEEIRRALPDVRAFLAKEVYVGDETSFRGMGKLALVAHSHLDLAYFWRVHQTTQKNARTCLIQLRLMDRYPEFLYAHTQPQTYETLKTHYPEIFEDVKRRVKEGRWEIVGAPYVEPDCNTIGAESLLRQCLYGKKFIEREFGVDVDNCWLPDVFGNSPIMPQVLKGCGVDYFVSNKMSTWNDTNRFPHNNFVWRGIDGTEIACCVPPVHFITWNDPQQLANSWNSFIDKDVCDESLHMYGYGDGGSGATAEMLDRIPLIEKLPGMPKVRVTSGKRYLHEAFADTDKLARWEGDLYLEMHRGTPTSKAILKRENRAGELRAFETEALCAMAAGRAGATYPVDALESAWKKILTNQFHDILPGSNTAPVTTDALETYAEASVLFEGEAEKARAALATSVGEAQGPSAFNPLAFERTDVVRVEEDAGEYAIQKQCVPGPEADATRGIAFVQGAPALGFVQLPPARSINNTLRVSTGHIENAFIAIRLNGRGEIVSVADKQTGREVVAHGKVCNELQLFEDRPGTYNAWDILASFEDHRHEMGEPTSVEVVERGPLTAGVRVVREFRSSKLVQVIRLHAHTSRIDFETWVDWHEREKLLKVAFPVSVHAPFYTCDTSAGGFVRPNHRNTTWEQARFEVCCHKWVDLSEGLAGAAVLNDSKYGCDVRGDTIRLSLLRGPIRPDPTSDEGEHRFTYSLLPHRGDWRVGGVVEEASSLNAPLRARRGMPAMVDGQIRISQWALHLQSLKCAEDGSGDIVLRLIELYGSRGTADVSLFPGVTWKNVTRTNMLERQGRPTAFTPDGLVEVKYRPYEIVTLRFAR